MISIFFRQKGFTLIEILVVISIITILSSVLYVSFGVAKEDARNKAMRTELKEMQLSLELYKAQFGRYPSVPTTCSTNLGGNEYISHSILCVAVRYISGLVPDYIAELPSEELSANPDCDVTYHTDNDDNSWYKLTALNCHAGATGPSDGVQPDDEFARCPSTCGGTGICDPSTEDFYTSYAVYSKGGECKE